MRVLKSVCTNLVFPESRRNIEEFRRMAEFLPAKGVRGIEFYHDGPHPDRVGKIAADAGLDPVYIAVIPSKEKRMYLCDLDRDNRRKAIDMLKGCLDECRDNNIEKLMINSGRIQDDVDKGIEALADSVEQLYNHADRRNQKIVMYLEPCDSNMQVFHLIGPYTRAVAFAEKIRSRGMPFFLTMDTAHVSEEGEDFMEAMEAAKPYCDHIHFANCRIDNPADPLYGDQHLGFEYSGTPWSPGALEKSYRKLEELYSGDDELRIALEVLCREDDPYAYFERMWESLPFLSRN